MAFAHNFPAGPATGPLFRPRFQIRPDLTSGVFAQGEIIPEQERRRNRRSRRSARLGWGASAGDRVRYDVITQESGIVTRDGYIRTYFIPEPSTHGYRTNLDYFLSQF